MSYSKDIWQEEREKDPAPIEEPTFEEEMEWEEIKRRQSEQQEQEREMSDAYERLNDEAERRTGELSARKFYERYKPGRDCDPAPVEEVTFEEELEWQEIKRRKLELAAPQTVTMDHANVEFLYHTIRDTLKDGGMPAGRATHFAWKIVKAFTEKG